MEKKKITVLVNKSAGHESCVEFLNERFDVNVIDCKEDLDRVKIDLMLFTGGEDVTPSYYGESKGKFTGNSEKRDDIETTYMYQRSRMHGIPKLGICRGAQFLTVMSGGKLIQHVNGHGMSGSHPLNMKHLGIDGEFKITSTHHQMMFPYNLEKKDYEIIATSSYFLSNTYLDGINQEKELPKDFEECEIVFYPNSNSLCIQGHPEYSNCPKDTIQECLNLIEQYLKL
jgi:GMP synthase-like glutamine amidotransferase